MAHLSCSLTACLRQADNVWHATVGDFDCVSVNDFGEGVGGGEAGVN